MRLHGTEIVLSSYPSMALPQLRRLVARFSAKNRLNPTAEPVGFVVNKVVRDNEIWCHDGDTKISVLWDVTPCSLVQV
jgi:hypothetical protein